MCKYKLFLTLNNIFRVPTHDNIEKRTGKMQKIKCQRNANIL